MKHTLRFSSILSLIFFLGTAHAAFAADDDIHFAADLDPDEETTPLESPGRGHIDLWLERATLKITWVLRYENLSSPLKSAGMYGPESPGFDAGLEVDLGEKGLKSPIKGSAILDDGQFQNLIITQTYINVLTSRFPKGAIRGQLRRQRENTTPPA